MEPGIGPHRVGVGDCMRTSSITDHCLWFSMAVLVTCHMRLKLQIPLWISLSAVSWERWRGFSLESFLRAPKMPPSQSTMPLPESWRIYFVSYTACILYKMSTHTHSHVVISSWWVTTKGSIMKANVMIMSKSLWALVAWSPMPHLDQAGENIVKTCRICQQWLGIWSSIGSLGLIFHVNS
jgi:hypothetical protein